MRYRIYLQSVSSRIDTTSDVQLRQSRQRHPTIRESPTPESSAGRVFRTDLPLPLESSTGLFYFEVELVSLPADGYVQGGHSVPFLRS